MPPLTLKTWSTKQRGRAERFWSWVATNRTLSTTVARVSIPVLLIYGAKDLIAPPEVGQIIYGQIQTPPAQKRLLILLHSRHGAEGTDVVLMQTAIRGFLNQDTDRGQ